MSVISNICIYIVYKVSNFAGNEFDVNVRIALKFLAVRRGLRVDRKGVFTLI